MNFAAKTGELFLSALAWRPVWIKYGLYGGWHALIKADMKVLADLRKPTCGAEVSQSLDICGTGLVPAPSSPICTNCLTDVLNVKGWTLEP